MKIYISIDLEGINGVSRFSQVENKLHPEYKTSLEQAYNEINTVIEAAFEAGAEYITVNDAHSSMSNLNLSNIDSRVSLITGKPKEISMMAGLDNSYNAAILLGYHAKAGTSAACLAHTMSESLFNVRLNKQAVGEAYLNSLYAATLNVPVAMVTGDEALAEEVYDQIGSIPSVITKQALGMSAVISKPNEKLFKELKETTLKTLNNPTNWIINKVPPPYELEVEFAKIIMADLSELLPGVNRSGSRKIQFTHTDFRTIYKLIQALCVVVSTAENYY